MSLWLPPATGLPSKPTASSIAHWEICRNYDPWNPELPRSVDGKPQMIGTHPTQRERCGADVMHWLCISVGLRVRPPKSSHSMKTYQNIISKCSETSHLAGIRLSNILSKKGCLPADAFPASEVPQGARNAAPPAPHQHWHGMASLQRPRRASLLSRAHGPKVPTPLSPRAKASALNGSIQLN